MNDKMIKEKLKRSVVEEQGNNGEKTYRESIRSSCGDAQNRSYPERDELKADRHMDTVYARMMSRCVLACSHGTCLYAGMMYSPVA
ncbi:MAG: hypothetical protein LBT78_05405 [Tannerella sp.]|jgi:hypothetical protein|nr:hypothetical protein [Tannerella sp.]